MLKLDILRERRDNMLTEIADDILADLQSIIDCARDNDLKPQAILDEIYKILSKY